MARGTHASSEGSEGSTAVLPPDTAPGALPISPMPQPLAGVTSVESLMDLARKGQEASRNALTQIEQEDQTDEAEFIKRREAREQRKNELLSLMGMPITTSRPQPQARQNKGKNKGGRPVGGGTNGIAQRIASYLRDNPASSGSDVRMHAGDFGNSLREFMKKHMPEQKLKIVGEKRATRYSLAGASAPKAAATPTKGKGGKEVGPMRNGRLNKTGAVLEIVNKIAARKGVLAADVNKAIEAKYGNKISVKDATSGLQALRRAKTVQFSGPERNYTYYSLDFKVPGYKGLIFGDKVEKRQD